MTEFSKREKLILKPGKYYANNHILLVLPSGNKGYMCAIPYTGFFYTPTTYEAWICHDGTTIYNERWPSMADWQQYAAQVVDNLHCKSLEPVERYQLYAVKYDAWLRYDPYVAMAMGISRSYYLDFKAGRRGA